MALTLLWLAACTVPPSPSWPQFRHDATGAGVAVGETAINPGNVASMVLDFETPRGYDPGAPVVANGRIYWSADGMLKVFDFNGVTNCSGTQPKVCAPLWTAPLFNSGWAWHPAVVNGLVIVVPNGTSYPDVSYGPLQAFDANGAQNCSGSPLVCSPVWESSSAVRSWDPVVANGFVYISTEASSVAAFDVNGVTNCSAGGATRICDPVWTTGDTGTANFAADDSILVAAPYMTSGRSLKVFDAFGEAGCAGSPKVCQPLWQSPFTSVFGAFPTIVGDRIYAPESNSVRVFATDGGPNCTGDPPVCQPLWQTNYAPATHRYSVAVAGGRLYAQADTSGESGEAYLAAYDTDPSRCSGAPVVCQPIWTAETPIYWGDSPIVANGVLIVGGIAFDTTSESSCTGTPPECPPIAGLGGIFNVVAGGRLIGMPEFRPYGNVVVYRLP